MKKVVIAWFLVIGWMGLIFYFSHQSGEDSSALSGGLTENIYHLLPFWPTDMESFHSLIRKAAHVGVYFGLGILVIHAFRVTMATRPRRLIIWAWILCTCYAITDEIHQLFIPGRSGEVSDVVLDSIGALVGIGLYVVLWKKFASKKEGS
ncbi:VanZ family protein [Natribacillus halophilus]|uniref:VanZ family protein n=1 Tax=Natribacillus halophilus TaxID=549003 RepID=UPI001FDF5976|nr:VanZ family protein [Natribacillus halophilus]